MQRVEVKIEKAESDPAVFRLESAESFRILEDYSGRLHMRLGHEVLHFDGFCGGIGYDTVTIQPDLQVRYAPNGTTITLTQKD